jgi:hypothetical protein
LHAPAAIDLLCGAAICIAGALLYARSPAIAASDREILAALMHGKERRILMYIGLLQAAPPKAA